MQKVDEAILADLDFRSLRFMRLLFQTRSVTRTGEILHLSQPAASRVLARLRTMLGDPLLLRTSKGGTLTPRAERLEPKVLAALSTIADIFAPEFFEPSQSTRTFQLASTDYGAAIVLPPLLAILSTASPKMQLDVSPWARNTLADLESGRLDFALYAEGDLPPDFHARHLFKDAQACLLRKNHPLIKKADRMGRILSNQIVKYPQIVMRYPDGLNTGIDEIIGDGGEKSPLIPLRIPYFLTAPLAVMQSDAVACIPLRLAKVLAQNLPCEVLEIKGDNAFAYRLIWHGRMHHDAGFKWLREIIAKQFSNELRLNKKPI